MSEPTVLVTGASGFVGGALVAELVASGYRVNAVVRAGREVPAGAQRIEVEDIGHMSVRDWAKCLNPGDMVVHCAALVHQMGTDSARLVEAYDRVNRKATETLARAAAQQGASRFVFLSTIKVNGEETHPGLPFTINDSVKPTDLYSDSKWRAEQALRSVAEEAELEWVIIRPPLVYGLGVGGNFAALVKLVKTGLPLPLAGVRNLRSLVALGNLVSLIKECLENANAPGHCFLVSDGDDISTPELLRRIGKAASHRACLLPFPQGWLIALGHVFGKGESVRRLCGSLQVDISDTQRILGWSPPVTMSHALEEVLGYCQETRCVE